MLFGARVLVTSFVALCVACGGSNDPEPESDEGESTFQAKEDNVQEREDGSCIEEGSYSRNSICDQPCGQPYRALCGDGRWRCTGVAPTCQPPMEPSPESGDGGVN